MQHASKNRTELNQRPDGAAETPAPSHALLGLDDATLDACLNPGARRDACSEMLPAPGKPELENIAAACGTAKFEMLGRLSFS